VPDCSGSACRIARIAVTLQVAMRVLFVCMGNICRSPTAEGVFARLLRERAPELDVEVDSAATHDYHVGSPPDPRAIAAAARRGVDLRALRARLIDEEDFARFDLIVAMDRLNRALLLERSPAAYHDRVRLLMEFASAASDDGDDLDVPDPYYGGLVGFERVLDLVEQAAAGLLQEIRSRAQRPRGAR
jgi:protein-tyrosine phosphatase